MRQFSIFALLLFYVLLSPLITACSTDKNKDKPKRLCPQTVIVRDLELIRDYGADKPDENSLVATALMLGVNGKCNYLDDGVDINFELKMAAMKKDRLGGNRISFPFFIAVVDPDRKILSKEMMTAEFKFHGDNKTADLTEQLHVFIPLEKDADAFYYQVLAGFQLTEDQLTDIRNKKDKDIIRY